MKTGRDVGEQGRDGLATGLQGRDALATTGSRHEGEFLPNWHVGDAAVLL